MTILRWAGLSLSILRLAAKLRILDRTGIDLEIGKISRLAPALLLHPSGDLVTKVAIITSNATGANKFESNQLRIPY